MFFSPTVIINIRNGSLEALYSNSMIRFIIVDQEDPDGQTITGPFGPTLEKPDLSQIADDLDIPRALLSEPADTPYF